MDRKTPLILIIWLLTACTPSFQPAAPAAVTPAPEASCPVTLPPADPFTPPEPYPPTPPGDYFWYGDESLWTALPPDGIWDTLPHNPTGYTQKLLWWRVGYSWTDEPVPDLQVTAHRLDDPAISFSESPATNAFAPEFQSAMLIGVDFPTSGCWQITGRYAEAELSYVVQIEPGKASASRAPATTASSPPAASPVPTPDEISRIKAANANQPEIVVPLLTPDGDWEAKTVVYGCVDIGDNEIMAYEALILTQLASGEEVVVAEQQQNCGGLGAAGLAALFWSPTARYLYYTDARDGVPDGCGFWQPTILRWDRTTGETERLGGGVVSPDGTKLAVWPPRERAVAVWNLDGGELGRVPAAAEAFPGPMAWSPDSQALVYLQVSSYCPPAGPSYIVRLDVATLEQTILSAAKRQAFRHVRWDAPSHLTLIDENEQRWTFDVESQTLEEAMNQPAPQLDDLTFAAMETVVAFNRTGGVRGTGPFLEISADLWHPAIAALQPLRVYWHQNNLAVVLEETDSTESGLYIGVPISSYMAQSDETIQLIHEADGLMRFSKKRSD